MAPPSKTVNWPSSAPLDPAPFGPAMTHFLSELNIDTTRLAHQQSPSKKKKKKKKVTFNLDAPVPHALHHRPPATPPAATPDNLKLNAKHHPSAGIKKKRRSRVVGVGSGVTSAAASAYAAAANPQATSPGKIAQRLRKKGKGRKVKPKSSSVNSTSLGDRNGSVGDGTGTGTGGHRNKNDIAPSTPDGASNANTPVGGAWMVAATHTNDPTEQEYASQIRAIFEQRREAGRKKREEEERRLVAKMYARQDAFLKHVEIDIIEPACRNMDKLLSDLSQRLGAQVKTIKEVDAWLKQQEQNDTKRAKQKDIIKQQIVKGYTEITGACAHKISHIQSGIDNRCREFELERDTKQSMSDYLGDILPKFVNMLRETPSKAAAVETANAPETADATAKEKATTTKGKEVVKGKVRLKKKSGRASKSHSA